MRDLGLTISNKKSSKNWVLKFFQVRFLKKKNFSCTSCLSCSFSITYSGNISNFPAKSGSAPLKTYKKSPLPSISSQFHQFQVRWTFVRFYTFLIFFSWNWHYSGPNWARIEILSILESLGNSQFLLKFMKKVKTNFFTPYRVFQKVLFFRCFFPI